MGFRGTAAGRRGGWDTLEAAVARLACGRPRRQRYLDTVIARLQAADGEYPHGVCGIAALENEEAIGVDRDARRNRARLSISGIGAASE